MAREPPALKVTSRRRSREMNGDSASASSTLFPYGKIRPMLLRSVKPIRSADVHNLYPQAPEMQPGMELFALHAADGTPILVTDTREAAVANAWSHELETVSVH